MNHSFICSRILPLKWEPERLGKANPGFKGVCIDRLIWGGGERERKGDVGW